MTDKPQLHSSIVAMVSLASGIASRHPDMGLCQLERLRLAGVPEHQIKEIIKIARHIRDEASDKVDHAFDELSDKVNHKLKTQAQNPTVAEDQSCCSSTRNGQRCC